MRALCHNCILNAVGAAKPPLSPPPPPPPNTKHKQNPFLSFSSSVSSNKWHQKLLLHALTGALSFNLLISSPTASIAEILSPPPAPAEVCKEEDFQKQQAAEAVPKFVSNEEIVEEAWEIVNEGFLNAGNLHRWSPDKWKQKKEDIIGSSIQTRSKAHDIIQRMLASLGDPYTRFLSPSENVNNLMKNLAGCLAYVEEAKGAIPYILIQFSKMGRYDMTGIGINLREVPDDNGTIKVQVLGIILDGPAHAAGVRQGDEILTVNGVDVRGKSAFEVSSLLQGPNETFVTIEVKHGNCGPIQSIDVQRRLVARTPVFYRLEEKKNGSGSVGYIRIKEFNALAMKDLVIAMKRLQDSGASFYILDLRDNLGGLVQAGIEVAKLFLNEGDTVIYTVGKDPQYQKNVIAETAPVVTAPVIVLVNNKTASASEIVASALHDNCRAVLVGERTYGKGLIQSVFELHDGSGIVVTVGKYVTPNHMEINGNGIEPDFRSIPDWAEVDKYLSQCHRKSG